MLDYIKLPSKTAILKLLLATVDREDIKVKALIKNATSPPVILET